VAAEGEVLDFEVDAEVAGIDAHGNPDERRSKRSATPEELAAILAVIDRVRFSGGLPRAGKSREQVRACRVWAAARALLQDSGATVR
jgi:hypothetical protein